MEYPQGFPVIDELRFYRVCSLVERDVHGCFPLERYLPLLQNVATLVVQRSLPHFNLALDLHVHEQRRIEFDVAADLVLIGVARLKREVAIRIGNLQQL